MNRYFYVLIALSLQGCYVPACLYLYNANEFPITYTEVQEEFDWSSEPYTINAMQLMRAPYDILSHVIVTEQSEKRSYCYKIPDPESIKKTINISDWFEASLLRGPTIYTLLGKDNKIYIFDKRSFGNENYFADVPPDQPPGFPVEPETC